MKMIHCKTVTSLNDTKPENSTMINTLELDMNYGKVDKTCALQTNDSIRTHKIPTVSIKSLNDCNDMSCIANEKQVEYDNSIAKKSQNGHPGPLNKILQTSTNHMNEKYDSVVSQQKVRSVICTIYVISKNNDQQILFPKNHS